MSNVKVVVTELDEVTRHEYTPVTAKCLINGKRKPDELEFRVPIGAKVNKEYEVTYIQDVADIDYLRAIWNFQLSILDDRGYNIDGADIDESRFVRPITGKFRGYYSLDFNATGQGVTIPYATASSRIDLSGQFDIYIWATHNPTQFISGGDEPILWSWYDGVRGIEIGITNQVTPSIWRGFVRIGTGVVVDTLIGADQEVFLSTSLAQLIRIYRGDDNIVRMEINGIEDSATYSTSTSLQNSSDDMVFGNGRGSDDHYRGHIHQVRVYCGSVLDENNSRAVMMSKPTPFTMKFAGNVWSIDDKTTYKIVKCLNHSQVFSNRVLSTDVITEAPIGGLSRTNNVYAAGQDLFLILEDIMNNIDSSFKLKTTLTPIDNDLEGTFTADGSFVDITKILLSVSDSVFFTTPRKLFIIESASGIIANIEFNQQGTITAYDITESSENDTKTVNELTLIGNGITAYRKDINDKVTYSARVNVPQISNQNDLNRFSVSIVGDLQSTKEGYLIKSGSFLNHIRFNYRADVINSVKSLNITEPIQSIEYTYPNGVTSLYVGEHRIDYLESKQIEDQRERGLQSTTTI